MFGMSLPEIIVILVVAVLVLGPDKLPEALVKFAKFFKYFKAQVNSAKSNFEQEVRIAELKADAAKLKDSITGVGENVRKKLTFEELDELKKGVSDFGNEVKNSLNFSTPTIASVAPNSAEFHNVSKPAKSALDTLNSDDLLAQTDTTEQKSENSKAENSDPAGREQNSKPENSSPENSKTENSSPENSAQKIAENSENNDKKA